MKTTKIVIIGAGSASFGKACIRDAFDTREIWGSELVFVDIDGKALDRMIKLAFRMNEELKAGFKITGVTDRCQALPGADFVIVSIAVNRNELWKHDFLVPKKYGINHVLGENGGPGAIFHTMRNVPIIMDICRDVEKLCPDALLINFTNPESRICLAISKYTRVRAVGLCHQIACGQRIISHITGVKFEDIDIKAYGLNHFTWMKDIRDKRTGEDLYPLLRGKEAGLDREYERLSRYMFHRYGLFPTSGDGHLGEYIPYAHEMMGTEGYDFADDENRRVKINKYIEGLIDGSVALDAPSFIWDESDRSSMLTPSGEKAFAIIKGIVTNTNEVLLSANLPNKGYITNLPADAIVEVPAVVSGNGINGLGMGELPRGIASLCMAQINVQHLNIDAAVTGDRNLVLQALLADPCVPGADAAEKIFNELMEIHKDYLPQFS